MSPVKGYSCQCYSPSFVRAKYTQLNGSPTTHVPRRLGAFLGYSMQGSLMKKRVTEECVPIFNRPCVLRC
jgi:hypothetical protein